MARALPLPGTPRSTTTSSKDPRTPPAKHDPNLNPSLDLTRNLDLNLNLIPDLNLIPNLILIPSLIPTSRYAPHHC